MDRKKIILELTIYFFCVVGFLLWLAIGAFYLTSTTVSVRQLFQAQDLNQKKDTDLATNPMTPVTPEGVNVNATASNNEEALVPTTTQTPTVRNTKINGATVTQNTARGIPQKFVIPKLGVTATVEQVGLDSAGRMDIPKSFQTVAWYKLGYKVGESGSAVLSGHYDTNTGSPAVLWNISKLAAGDEMRVTDTAGTTYTYKVTEKKVYPYDSLPLQQIFATSGTSMLNVITCSGTWDKTSKNYSTRTVIYAKQI